MQLQNHIIRFVNKRQNIRLSNFKTTETMAMSAQKIRLSTRLRFYSLFILCGEDQERTVAEIA